MRHETQDDGPGFETADLQVARGEQERDLAVVFVRTKRGADNLVERLRTFGVRATGIHGGMTQRERLRRDVEEGFVSDGAARALYGWEG